MIRENPIYLKARCGFSLAELAFALLVIGVVLGGMWLKVAGLYGDYEVTKADKELRAIVQNIRLAHTDSRVTNNENFDNLNLPTDMIGHFQARTILVNPWRGQMDIFPGNAIAGGRDYVDDSFTVQFNGVPNEACKELIEQNTTSTVLSMGLVAVATSFKEGENKEICFVQDNICTNYFASITKNQINNLCGDNSHTTVLFTFMR